MKNTKLIILLSQPLTKFNSRRFGLYSSSKNFNKEFWYLLPLINKKLSQKDTNLMNLGQLSTKI